MDTAFWKKKTRRLRKARETAEDLISSCGINSAPIDLSQFVESESPLLTAEGADFGDLFDGQLEYHPSFNRFLLFYNTKYNSNSHSDSLLHPRTRFSFAHELGHYYLDEHRNFLLQGGKPHQSESEFTSTNIIECEADAFAAGLLLPREILAPETNFRDLSFNSLIETSEKFQTSITATGITAIQLSEHPCALVAVREGRIAWQVLSESLIENGCYPNYSAFPNSVKKACDAFLAGQPLDGVKSTSRVGDWCRTYNRLDTDQIFFEESYLSIPVMSTMLVLLTADEQDF